MKSFAIVACLVLISSVAASSWSEPSTSGYQPASRKFHSGVVIGNEVVYFGGTNGANSFNDVYSWNLSSNKITNLTAPNPSYDFDGPIERHLHAAMVLPGNVFCGAGFITHGGHIGAGVAFTDDMWRWSMSDSSWTKAQYSTTDNPPPRAGHAAAIIDNEIFIYGGTGPNATNSSMPHIGYDDLWSFNLITGAWTFLMSDCPPGVRSGIIGASHGGVLYFYGGQDMEGNAYGDLWAYDPKNADWSIMPAGSITPGPNSFYQATISGDSFIMFGGTNTIESNNAIWEYSLSHKHWQEMTPSGTPPTAVSGSAGGVHGDVLAIQGGAPLPGGSVTDQFAVYKN